MVLWQSCSSLDTRRRLLRRRSAPDCTEFHRESMDSASDGAPTRSRSSASRRFIFGVLLLAGAGAIPTKTRREPVKIRAGVRDS